jgi:hypothetical protein
MLCGHPEKEVVFAETGFNAISKHGFSWNGWELPVSHARADTNVVEIELNIPKNESGLLRVYVIDPDNFHGGRKEKIALGKQAPRPIENFENGKWLERLIDSNETADGKVTVRATNASKDANAVISIVEWVSGSGAGL